MVNRTNMDNLIFNVPHKQSVKGIETLLRQNVNLSKQTSSHVRRTYLDTIDCRIFNKGGVLETTTDSDNVWLSWRSLGTGKVIGKYQVDQLPRFEWDIKTKGLRTRLKKILDVRALLPVVTVESEVHSFSVLDSQSKTTLRIEIQSDYIPCQLGEGRQLDKRPKVLKKRIHLFPLKGYKKVLKQVSRVLEQECNLVPPNSDPFVTTLDSVGHTPCYMAQELESIWQEQRADIAVKSIFMHLLNAMEQNENGVRHDIDSEFLHDFRVAVRRTRSLLRQTKSVLPKPRISRFSREFAWLGRVTGPTRDMDVYILTFGAYQRRLPLELREDLVPLYEFLLRHKKMEHARMVKVLDTVRYKRLKKDWKKFLTDKPPVHSTLAHADSPIGVVASQRIWHICRKVIKQGRAIKSDSPATMLHELRKTCKKLRYMNEFFQDIYPRNKIRKLINNLKVLQDNLGEFQDLEVQQVSLRNFIQTMDQETGITNETRHAITVLVARLEERDQKVREEFSARFKKFASSSNQQLYEQICTARKQFSVGGK
jgi:CHAD domain-containing protein